MAALNNDGDSFDNDEFHNVDEEEKPIDRNKVVGVSLNSIAGLIA